MQEFQKIKVSTNTQSLQQSLSIYEGRIQYYQDILNSIIEIIPDFTFSSNDLKTLFDNPKAYLVDKIIAEPTKIGGIELSKDKVFELLEDYDRLKNVVSNIQKLKQHNLVDQSQSNINSYTNYYEINSNNEVSLKETTIEWLEDNASIFVKSQRQADAHASLTIILNELNKLGKTYTRNHMKFIDENLDRNYEGVFSGINYKQFHSLE